VFNVYKPASNKQLVSHKSYLLTFKYPHLDLALGSLIPSHKVLTAPKDPTSMISLCIASHSLTVQIWFFSRLERSSLGLYTRFLYCYPNVNLQSLQSTILVTFSWLLPMDLGVAPSKSSKGWLNSSLALSVMDSEIQNFCL